MSITICGKLVVRQINGRRGQFSVGELITDIGSFKVKDQILDQFEQGEYKGNFVIERIFPDSYVYFGRAVIEIRALVSEVFLDEAQEGEVPDLPEHREPDPVDQQAGSDESAQKVPAETLDAGATEQTDAADVDTDLALFGAEILGQIQGGEPVKLDPTIERVQFRSQVRRLKEELGYTFKAQHQTWFKS